MRDLLVPIFGDWGAVVAQYLLTVVIVLGLIGAVWWVMRRYSGVHFGGIGRGRVPRLAIVDALAVDRRRRLILVRRDNVEHLLLIGGPSDVVVEGTIQRVRQRSVQAAAQAAVARATLPPAVETPAEPEPPQPETADAGGPERPANEPIPFPLARSAHLQAASGNGRPQPARQRPVRLPESTVTQQPAAAPPPARTATFVEPQRPTRLQPMPAAPPPPEAEPQAAAEPAPEALLPEVMTAEAEPLPPAPPPAPAPATFAEAEWEAAEEARQSALDLGDGDAPATASGEEEMVPVDTAGEEEAAPVAAPEQDGTAPADPAARVGDLEREMARLLDEITTRRSS